MDSTVWASRENPLYPGDLEVVQFSLDGQQLDVVNISGCTRALIAATFDTLVVASDETIFTYAGGSISSYTLPKRANGLSLHSGGFGVLCRNPTNWYRARYYESLDGYSWTLKTPGDELFYLGNQVQYEFSKALNVYVLNTYDSSETPDQTLRTTVDHSNFYSLPKYIENISGEDYAFGPNAFIVSGTDIFYSLSGAAGAPSIPAKVAKVPSDGTISTFNIVGIPAGSNFNYSTIFYDYDGTLAVIATAFFPTYEYDEAVYRFNGSAFVRDRVYVGRENGSIPDEFSYDARRDLRSGSNFLSLSTSGCAAGAFRIHNGASYVEIASAPDYAWHAGAIAFLPSSAFWTRKIRCFEA